MFPFFMIISITRYLPSDTIWGSRFTIVLNCLIRLFLAMYSHYTNVVPQSTHGVWPSFSALLFILVFFSSMEIWYYLVWIFRFYYSFISQHWPIFYIYLSLCRLSTRFTISFTVCMPPHMTYFALLVQMNIICGMYMDEDNTTRNETNKKGHIEHLRLF